jgi:hypothetical protein
MQHTVSIVADVTMAQQMLAELRHDFRQDQFYPATVEQIPLHFKVTDVNGNSATETATVTVEDKIAPVVLLKTIPFSSHQCMRVLFR